MCKSLTWQSSYTQLYVGFALSGLLHMAGDAIAPKGVFGASFWFFFSQAIAISFEDAVVGAAKRAGVRLPEWMDRTIGYVWTFWWGVHSLGPYLSYRFTAETMEPQTLPFSPVMAVLGHPTMRSVWGPV